MAHGSAEGTLSGDEEEDGTQDSFSTLSYLSGASSMKPKFDAMLKEIEQKLPSLDDDDSDFEDGSGDEIEIFQRPSGYGQLVAEDADKDLDESLTSSDFSERWCWKASSNGGTNSNNQLTEHNQTQTDVEVASHELNMVNNNNDSQSWLQDSNRNAEYEESLSNSSPQPPLADLTLYDSRDAEMQSPPPNGISPRPHTASPRTHPSRHRQSRPSRRDVARAPDVRLSLGTLENIDLDIILQNVVDDEYQRHQRSRSSSLDLFDLRPGDNVISSRDPNKCTELMQNLVSFSAKQSGKKLDIDPMSGADRSKRRVDKNKRIKTLNKYEADAISEKAQKRGEWENETMHRAVSTGTSTAGASADNYKVLTSRPKSEQQSGRPSTSSDEPIRSTVFIDLRKTERELEEERNRLAVVQRVLQINTKRDESSDSSSDSSNEDDRDTWFEQRRRIRQAIQRGESAPPPLKLESKVKPPKRLTQPQRVVRSAPAQRVMSSTCSNSTLSEDEEVKERESPINEPLDGAVASNTDSTLRRDINRMQQRILKTDEVVRKAKADAERILKVKKAFVAKLNSQKPTLSVDKKRCAAEMTPTIYSTTSSHEPPLRCLPDNISDREEVTVLTINLSSNGEIVPHRSPASHALDKAEGCSSSYIALVTWLCACIPDNVDDPNPHVVHHYPFNVLGLQQIVIDDKLVLAVAVVPVGDIDEKCLPANKAGTKKNSKSPFLRLLEKFLATMTLEEVNPFIPKHRTNTMMPKVDGAQFVYTSRGIEFSNKPLSTFIQVQTNPDSLKQYFEAEIGFHFQTMNNDEQCHYADDEVKHLDKENPLEITLTLFNKDVYREPNQLFCILIRISYLGFDICGLRLATHEYGAESGPVLVVAIRGAYAILQWELEMGPMDPKLAKISAPGTCMALFGGDSREKPKLYTPRIQMVLEEEIARWFGGRVADSQLSETPNEEAAAAATESLDDSISAMAKPVYLLSATTSSDVFVIVSHLLPIKCIGILLSVIQNRGYFLRGIRRRRLNQKQVSALGINAEFASYYLADYANLPTSPRGVKQDSLLGQPSLAYAHPTAPQPTTIFHLSKENASHCAPALVDFMMSQLTAAGLLDDASNAVDGELTRRCLFHFAPYSSGLLAQLGRDFTRVPELDSPASTGYIAPRLHSNMELEQISVLTLVGNHVISGRFCFIVARLLGAMPPKAHPQFSVDPHGLELLGIKWVPALNSTQARELTPYEVGQPAWRPSIKRLCSEPALIMVFRGLNCTQRIKDIIHCKSTEKHEMFPLDRMVSPTPELAYRLTSLFFFDRELFADNASRPLLLYLPPLRSEIKSPADTWDDEGLLTKPKRPRSGRGAKTPPRTPPTTPPQSTKFVEESVYKTMQMGPRPIVTVLVMKPSVLAKKNLAKLLRGILRERFQIVGMRLMKFSEIEAACIQSDKVRKNDTLYKEDLAHMTSGSSLILALSRENAVKKLLDLLGPEDPKEARQEDPFLWRGMHGSSLVANSFYASKSYPGAVADMKQFFIDGLCCSTTIDLTTDGIPSPGVDVRISATDREAREQVNLNPGPYNLARLNEVNCIVMLPPLVRLEADSRNAKFTDIIQCLQAMDVSILGARMVWLTEGQAQDYLHVIKAGTFAQVPILCSAPLIVLAVQCNNAVISFNYIIEMGMLKIGLDKEEYLKYMQTGKDVKAAGCMLAYFFDELIGDECKLKIHEKSSAESSDLEVRHERQ